MTEAPRYRKLEEEISHKDGEIVIGLTNLPDDRVCVAMTHEGKTYVMFAVLQTIAAYKTQNDLKREFGIITTLGHSVNTRESVSQNKIVLLSDINAPISGLFVEKEELIDKLPILDIYLDHTYGYK